MPDPLTRSQSLYRLSYLAHTEVEGRAIFGGAVSMGVNSFAGGRTKILRQPVEVERVNTGRLKSTPTRTEANLLQANAMSRAIR